MMITREDWQQVGLHSHLYEEYASGKWGTAEIRYASGGKWLIIANRGDCVLGQFQGQGSANKALRTLIEAEIRGAS